MNLNLPFKTATQRRKEARLPIREHDTSGAECPRPRGQQRPNVPSPEVFDGLPYVPRCCARDGRTPRDTSAAPSHLRASALSTSVLSQNGVALVITLLMLSVITFLAIAFLALSRRDRASVGTTMSQTESRFAADTALARAQSEILSHIMARGDLLSHGLLVSTNYINPAGFDPSSNPLIRTNLTNVNYDFRLTDGNPLSQDELIQNIANLFHDPRPPVFVRTNRDSNLPLEFRFWVDYNRNGLFDTNGFLPEIGPLGRFLRRDGTETQQVNDPDLIWDFFTGDPEWIGVLEKPEYPHSRTNLFTHRYAYLALPISKTLDVNFIHNQAKSTVTKQPMTEGFLRNQGVGPWEINLAAFLRALNTNIWTTNYYDWLTIGPSPTQDFQDANSILQYRYGGNFNNLADISDHFAPFGAHAATAFEADTFDRYSDGPLMTNTAFTVLPADRDDADNPWPGSSSMNTFYEPQEFFDPNKTSPYFVNQIRQRGTNNASYDRYTFYRLLSQLGTESAPEVRGKININYVNDPNDAQVSTNFAHWTPVQFFTNTANLLIAEEPGLKIHGITNLSSIQIYPTNQYTPRIHQLLQIAANLHDATTHRMLTGSTNLLVSSVFKPLYYRGTTGHFFIAGYEEVTDDASASTALGRPWLDPDVDAERNQITSIPNNANVHGIPYVIGARKGYPNFNEFALITALQITRKLEFLRPNTSSPPNQTNHMYLVSATNWFGTEVWNSYANHFNRRTRIILTNNISFGITTRDGQPVLAPASENYSPNPQPLPLDRLRRFRSRQDDATNFYVFTTNGPALPTAKVLPGGSFTTNANQFQFETGPFESPDWVLNVTNRLTYVMIDDQTGRILDFVSLRKARASFDLARELNRPTLFAGGTGPGVSAPIRDLWRTDLVRNSRGAMVPRGIETQISISTGVSTVSDTDWKFFSSSVPNTRLATTDFRDFMAGRGTELRKSAPFQPTTTLIFRRNWQANDPLVHYTLNDLTDPKASNIVHALKPPDRWPDALPLHTGYNLGKVNNRYNPWGGNPFQPGEADEVGAYNMGFKDPLVEKSDDWNFPTNKFPNIGWLGRVHRGTPWQTIYLKGAPPTPLLSPDQIMAGWSNSWRKLWHIDPATHPTNDWRLVDRFYTAPNDNAARGLLSVNQTHLASWAALFGGVLVITNPAQMPIAIDPNDVALPVDPADIENTTPPLMKIFNELTDLRARRPNGVFQSIGEILAATNLTVSSPYLDKTAVPEITFSDAVYEWIPQQVLSLLKVGHPRYVIYAYGQALKPADASRVQNPPGNRMELLNLCTNYQITGEVVTRTVLRIERAPDDRYRTVVESYNVLSGD